MKFISVVFVCFIIKLNSVINIELQSILNSNTKYKLENMNRNECMSNENLLINGDFEIPFLEDYEEILDTIDGWTSNKSIKLWHGVNNKRNWGETQLCHLDYDPNIHLYQEVELKEEKRCILQFTFSSEVDASKNSYMLVRFNSKDVFKYIAEDVHIYTERIKVQGLSGLNKVEFISMGPGNNNLSLDNVKLTCECL